MHKYPWQSQSFRNKHTCRRGISTIWVIVALPVVMAVFVFVIDIAHIWLARNELKNALDAAALSGVQTWGTTGNATQARLDTEDAFEANTILGSVVMINSTPGAGVNGNDSTDCEILLGSITDTGTTNVFDCSASPSCISGTATVVFEVNTTGGDTFANTTDSFRLVSFEDTTGGGPPTLTLNSITLDLSPMMLQPSGGGTNSPDNGFFDTRSLANGNDPDNRGGFGPPQIGSDPQSAGATFAFTGGTVGERNIMTVTFGTAITSDASPGGSEFFFGVDTDRVGGNTGQGGGVTAQDFGGEFGTDTAAGGSGNDPFTSVGARFSANISGATVFGTLDRIDADVSRAVLMVSIVSGGTSFGVRTRKTIQVRSIGPTFLNLGLGPYDVSAESFAQFVCSNGPPKLVFIDGIINCVCP